MNEEYAKKLINGGQAGDYLTADQVRELIARNVKVIAGSVRITAFTLDLNAKTAYLYVNGEVETDTAGEALAAKYDVAPATLYANVTVKVYWKASLSDQWPANANWSIPQRIGRDDKRIDVNLSAIPSDKFSSGFFKVEVVQ